ncbi:MAG: hypothetical protein OEM63_11360 [Gammaproteobacteria bacterium]|nr:hypothetical protein [Gammaproteobacteria bacterium]
MNTLHLVRVIAAIFVSIALGACASGPPTGPGSTSSPYIITINFASAASCTINSVSAALPACSSGPDQCVGQNEFIQWESNPGGIKYEIYFDPIKGAPLKSGGNGVLKRKIDDDAPYALYKYSILKDGCDPTADVFDPRFRVDH